MYFVLFTSLLLLGSVASCNEEYYRLLDALVQESGCSKAGGFCTFAADCPQVLNKGLCPEQRSQGVECCFGISLKENRCYKRGGRCMPKEERCNEKLVDTRATDCTANEKCCILV